MASPANDQVSQRTVTFYKRKRTVVKTKITKLFNKFDSDDSPTVDIFRSMINELLSEITSLDDSMNQVIMESNDGVIDDVAEQEFTDQVDYVSSIRSKLAECELNSKPSTAVNNDHLTYKLPPLKCDTFSGENTTNLEFHSFMMKFSNVIGSRKDLSDSIKLTYLKSYLKGYAYKVVQHLHITDQNYKLAQTLLGKEFLDENTVVNDLISNLLTLKPKYDNSYMETKLFINEVRCIISDLENCDIDILNEKSGNAVVSHVVFNKLPLPFRQELIRKLSSNFPSLKEIFDNYVEIINLLKIRNEKPKEVQSRTSSCHIWSKMSGYFTAYRNSFQTF